MLSMGIVYQITIKSILCKWFYAIFARFVLYKDVPVIYQETCCLKLDKLSKEQWKYTCYSPLITDHETNDICMCVWVWFSLLVFQPQCTSEVIQVSVGAFTLQTARQCNQILQGLKGSSERETLNGKLGHVYFCQTEWSQTYLKCKIHKDVHTKLIKPGDRNKRQGLQETQSLCMWPCGSRWSKWMVLT